MKDTGLPLGIVSAKCTMAGFGQICPKSPKLKFWVFRYLTRQNGRRHLVATYSRPKSNRFCADIPKNMHGI